ncbi:hypothetical protein BGZ81_007637, partial [Podila clonocystis]
MSVAAARLLLITLPFLALLVLTVVSAQSALTLNSNDNHKTHNVIDGQNIIVELKEDKGEGYVLTYGDVHSSDEAVVAPFESQGSFKAVGAEVARTADLVAMGT